MNETALISGWERTAQAVEQVKERLQRAVEALQNAGVPYCVVGGNAVAEWVGRVEPAAVRSTKDVDILIRRIDLDSTINALQHVGFRHDHIWGVDLFIDGVDGKPQEGIHVVFAGERVKPGDFAPNPDVEESEAGLLFQVVSIPALVTMKLTAYRLKDRMHLLDLIAANLVDDEVSSKLSEPLKVRLQMLIEEGKE